MKFKLWGRREIAINNKPDFLYRHNRVFFHASLIDKYFYIFPIRDRQTKSGKRQAAHKRKNVISFHHIMWRNRSTVGYVFLKS